MNVSEVLAFQPAAGGKRRSEEEEDSSPKKKSKQNNQAGDPMNQREKILEMLDETPDVDTMDESGLKKLILNFEKKVLKNQQMRIKHPDMPNKFLDSEMELNDILHEMHAIATVPDLYHIVVELNSVQTLLQLLGHDNTDIAISVVDLMQEMTDVDALEESEEGAAILIDALMDGQVVALLVHTLEKLDESIKSESEGVHNTLGIMENMLELRPEISGEVAQQGLLQWLLKRLKAKIPFDANKLYSSEILAILLQNHEDNRTVLGEMDGIDILLQQLAAYKRHDPSNNEEIELMENLFNCLCSCLMLRQNRDLFLKGEGLQLMNLMLREKKLSRCSAIRVLNHALSGNEGRSNCQKFVDILGLRSIFPLFMKPPVKNKRAGISDKELEEHIISIISSLFRNCEGTQRQRLVNKFTECDHEKVDRLMELHFKYLTKVKAVDDVVEEERKKLRIYGEIDEDTEDQFYVRRLDAGLFTLQLADYVIMEVCRAGASSVKQRVNQILTLRGASVKAIKNIMRDYASVVGDDTDPDAREEEQDRIYRLVDDFNL